jgi:hypothetical protein
VCSQPWRQIMPMDFFEPFPNSKCFPILSFEGCHI